MNQAGAIRRKVVMIYVAPMELYPCGASIVRMMKGSRSSILFLPVRCCDASASSRSPENSNAVCSLEYILCETHRSAVRQEHEVLTNILQPSDARLNQPSQHRRETNGCVI